MKKYGINEIKIKYCGKSKEISNILKAKQKYTTEGRYSWQSSKRTFDWIALSAKLDVADEGPSRPRICGHY